MHDLEPGQFSQLNESKMCIMSPEKRKCSRGQPYLQCKRSSESHIFVTDHQRK